MKEQMVYIDYKDKKYPMIFTLNCMETIQEKYGSMEAWMEELGKKDENGEKAEPNIKLLKFGLGLMINEAIDIENEDKEESEKMPLVDDKTIGRIVTALGLSETNKKLSETVIASTNTGEPEKNE